ncbi:hypothetical protein SOVF_023320 [Spinacia oleracea]|nr:hypothetical protein SOVF_023320 [Spinacia oleracea]
MGGAGADELQLPPAEELVMHSMSEMYVKLHRCYHRCRD